MPEPATAGPGRLAAGSRPRGSASRRRLTAGGSALTLGALGVVFGDIGTSPLYALQAVFSPDGGAVPIDQTSVYGAISLVFWAITLVVSIKYVTFVLRADNNGEGGIMALVGLLDKASFGSAAVKGLLVAVGIAGAALFYGDGMITPAISVLSAVEGLEVTSPSLSDVVVPITLVIVTSLFAIQRYGTAAVGRLFGPVTLLWFLALAAGGLAEVASHPAVLHALSPVEAVDFFATNASLAFLALASVVLVVTGAEALYADLGHFGLPPIRRAWFFLVFPALTLQYLGQGSLILRSPGSESGTLFLLYPEALRLPMVALATAATVIASQALITGAFSISRQADQMGLVPRLSIRHTSSELAGQVYIPAINWILFVGILGIVIGFGSSANLASAYGIAVTGTFVITTILFCVIARKVWRKSLPLVVAGAAVLLTVDLAFFSANLRKVADGGWLPLTIAAVIFIVLRTWMKGREAVTARRRKMEGPLRNFIEDIQWRRLDVARVPGTGVFLNADRQTVPLALRAIAEHTHVLPEQVVLLTVQTHAVAVYEEAAHLAIDDLGYADDGINHVTGRYGFREEPDVQALLRLAKERGLDIDDPERCSYYLSRISIGSAAPVHEMTRWRRRLFIGLTKYAASPVDYFNLPRDRVVVMGGQIHI